MLQIHPCQGAPWLSPPSAHLSPKNNQYSIVQSVKIPAIFADNLKVEGFIPCLVFSVFLVNRKNKPFDRE